MANKRLGSHSSGVEYLLRKEIEAQLAQSHLDASKTLHV